MPHKHKLYNFIQKSLNFSEDADDVFQETVMRAFKYFYAYKKDKKFRTWIFTIAHNEVKKYFKKARKYDSVADIERLKSSEPDDSRELVQEVYRFAERLKPKHRQVFFLFYYSGFSISEVSHITGIKEGTIKFMLNRARNDLKKIIGEQNGK
jgi:RNA polymerase sigma-70 factor (ECF subfamily)